MVPEWEDRDDSLSGSAVRYLLYVCPDCGQQASIRVGEGSPFFDRPAAALLTIGRDAHIDARMVLAHVQAERDTDG
jgi:hypothetical protein